MQLYFWTMNKLKKNRGKLKQRLLEKLRLTKSLRLKNTLKDLYQRDRLPEAATLAIRSAAAYPDEWFFHYRAGTTLRKLGHDREACRYFSQALNLRPDHGESAKRLIDAIAESKNSATLAEDFSHSLFVAWASTENSVHINRLLSAAAPANLDRAAQLCSQYHRAAGRSSEIVIGPIRTVRDWAKLTRAPLREAGEIETIPFMAPRVHGVPESSEIILGKSNKPYVAEIANARIFSKLDLVLTQDGSVLSDEAGHEEFGQFVSYEYARTLVLRQRDRLLIDLTRHKTRRIEAAAFLAGPGSGAFGHWFPEYLPRIEFFRKHPDFVKLPIVVDATMPKSHFDQLRRLTDNEFILLQPDESLICGRLLVASSPTFLPVALTVETLEPHSVPGMSPRAYQFLQRELPRRPAPKAPFRRIFLARRKMGWRLLLNEADVTEALAKLGFEIVYVEDLNADEQIELFQEAEWIVGPHGSALLNIIFASPAAKILVLSQPKLFNWGAFQGPMEVLGYRPLCVCAEYATDPEKKHSDYSVSPGLVVEALQSMGLRPMTQNAEVARETASLDQTS